MTIRALIISHRSKRIRKESSQAKLVKYVCMFIQTILLVVCTYHTDSISGYKVCINLYKLG